MNIGTAIGLIEFLFNAGQRSERVGGSVEMQVAVCQIASEPNRTGVQAEGCEEAPSFLERAEGITVPTEAHLYLADQPDAKGIDLASARVATDVTRAFERAECLPIATQSGEG